MRRCERVRVGVHMRVCLRMPVGTCESRRFLQPLPSPPPPRQPHLRRMHLSISASTHTEPIFAFFSTWCHREWRIAAAMLPSPSAPFPSSVLAAASIMGERESDRRKREGRGSERETDTLSRTHRPLHSSQHGAIGSGALLLRCCRLHPRPFRAACWPPPASWERERATEERGRGEGAKERQTRSHAPTDLCILLNMVPSGVAHCCCDAAVSIRTLSEQRVGRRQHHGLVVVLGIGQPENRSAHPHIHRAEARLEGRERDL